MTPRRWLAIATFFVVACAISWPLFWLQRHSGLAVPLPQPLVSLGFMWGPGIAALIAGVLFRGEVVRTWTLLGGWRFALLFYVVPLLVLVAVLVPLVGPRALILLPLGGVFGFLMTLGEELGWRGWLQQATAPLGRWGRYGAIGLLWEIWHMRFGSALFDGEAWSAALIFELRWFVLAVAISAVLGEAFDRSRALVVPVTLHLWINLVLTGEIQQIIGPVFVPVYAVAALAMAWWLWLLARRPQAAGVLRPA